MKKILTTAAVLLAATLPVAAQNWSIGVGTGPFVFGDFVERKVRPSVGGTPAGTVTMSLSAETRAGLTVDVQRDFSERWGLRLEGTFTRAPLNIKEEGDDAITLDAGELDVSTFTLPLVFRINPRGSFRFHVMGGPAYAVYRFNPNEGASGVSVFTDTRAEWGLALGGGVGWWISDRFAIEGNLSDVVTSSPFNRDDYPDVPGYTIPRPHNVHTTVGARWRF
jgi:hypothetical protein